MTAPQRRRSRRPLLLGLLLVVVALAAGALVALREARARLAAPHVFAAPGGTKSFEVAAGSSSRAILARLEAEGVVRSALLARLFLQYSLGDPPLLAGEYEFVPPASTIEILRILRSGEIATRALTLVEGLTWFETAEAIAAAGWSDLPTLRRELSSPERIRTLDADATTLEGYLFPDTYRFPPKATADAIAEALVASFRRQWQERVRPALRPDDRRPLRELVILASLVEKEAQRAEERPLVAAVYANRLRQGIGLYADPTIIYGLKLAGRWDGDIRRRDLEADQPWNSYKRPGLPPGPIASPGLAALLAAARPAEVDFLYFVSRNDGSHVFSATLAEHNRNVERWQRQYFRDRKRSPSRHRAD